MRWYRVTSEELYRTYYRVPVGCALANPIAWCFLCSFHIDVWVKVEGKTNDVRIVEQKEELYA